MFGLRGLAGRLRGRIARLLGRAPARGAERAARFETRSRDGRVYKLFLPADAAAGDPLPLVVMLHGGGQDPDGFARDTRMNELAAAETFLVAYPEQDARRDPHRCWGWFDPEHRKRGAGEPAEIVGIVDAIAAETPVRRDRVFVAGLSAGAAMSVVLGALYPDRFAAVGAAAGLPFAAASDRFDALILMRGIGDRLLAGEWPGPWGDYWAAYAAVWADSPFAPPTPHAAAPVDAPSLGERAVEAMGSRRRPVPMVLFQGTADEVVEPGNGEALAAQWALAGDAVAATVTERDAVRGGRTFTVTTHAGADGDVLIRAYTIDGMGHAWPGGAAGGRFTDPRAPDATRLIWRFFADHPMPEAV